MMNPRIAYCEADVRGASAVRLVVLLYDQIVQDLSQAGDAIEQKDIELRTKRINHAILVIGHLQSRLDFDNGGKVAKDLDNFYNVLRQNLVEVQFFPSRAGIRQLITDVLAAREAWIEVERAEGPSIRAAAAAAGAANGASAGAAGAEPDPARRDWKG